MARERPDIKASIRVHIRDCIATAAVLAAVLAGALPASACTLTIKQRLDEKVFGGYWLTIPSSSMWPQVDVSAGIFAHGFADGVPKTIERGDVIVFCLERDSKTIYIKRVIGLPGETIGIVGNRISIDGVEMARQPVAPRELGDHQPVGPRELDVHRKIPCYRETSGDRSWEVCQTEGDRGPGATVANVTVPAGDVFVLGDNRDNSADSRYPRDLGRVRVDNVIGIVRFLK